MAELEEAVHEYAEIVEETKEVLVRRIYDQAWVHMPLADRKLLLSGAQKNKAHDLPLAIGSIASTAEPPDWLTPEEWHALVRFERWFVAHYEALGGIPFTEPETEEDR